MTCDVICLYNKIDQFVEDRQIECKKERLEYKERLKKDCI